MVGHQWDAAVELFPIGEKLEGQHLTLWSVILEVSFPKVPVEIFRLDYLEILFSTDDERKNLRSQIRDQIRRAAWCELAPLTGGHGHIEARGGFAAKAQNLGIDGCLVLQSFVLEGTILDNNVIVDFSAGPKGKLY